MFLRALHPAGLAPAAGAPLTWSEATTLDEVHRLRPEWDQLLAAVDSPTVFQSWDWVAAWFEAFAAHQSMWVLTLRDSRGQLVGVVPGALTSGRLATRTLGLLGRGSYLAEYGDAAIHSAFVDQAAATIAEAWGRTANTWDRLVLHNVAPDGPLSAAAKLLADRGYRCVVTGRNAAVRRSLPTTWQAFYRSLHKSMKDNVNNYANRLRRDGYEIRMVLATLANLDESLDCLFRLHHLRASSGLRPPHHDYFAAADKRHFLRTVARRLIERGRLELALLEVDGQPVAAQVCLAEGGRFSPYYSGYDPVWARYGVMMVLTRCCIEWGIERGYHQLDLLCGATHEKLRWAGKPAPLISILLTGPRARSRASRLAYHARHAQLLGRGT
jgi:CelD/BcsL family acetyltransferase involved in cellulose biosynthesis